MAKQVLRSDQAFEPCIDKTRALRYDRDYDADKDKAAKPLQDSVYWKGQMPYAVSLDAIWPGGFAVRGLFPGYSQWLGTRQRPAYTGDRQYSPLDLAGTNSSTPKVPLSSVYIPRTPANINVNLQ